VIFIISVMIALLMPALQHAREASRRVACQSNLHQLWIAMRQGISLKKAPPNSVGGWSMEILPLIEQKAAADDFKRNPSLTPGKISSFAFVRPGVLTCSSAYDGQSIIAPIPVGHYMASDPWSIGDVSYGSQEPWVIGMIGMIPLNGGPHDGGYNVTDYMGGVEFKSAR
jgi:hypothetical protein